MHSRSFRPQQPRRNARPCLGKAAACLALLAALTGPSDARRSGPAEVGDAEAFSRPRPPAHPDSVLRDLAGIGVWRGGYRPGVRYRIGDIVVQGDVYFFAWRDDAVLGRGFEPLPLVEGEELAFEEDFDGPPGPLATGEPIAGRYAWSLTGAGHANAMRGRGYLTSAGNTYFVVNDLPRRISEFGSIVRIAHPDSVATMALQRFGFGEMWHVNFGVRGAGDTTYWRAGRAGIRPEFRFAWNSGRRLEVGRSEVLLLRVRGNFVFGYVGGELAFVQMSPLIGEIAGQASSVYVQNHAELPNVERQERIWVKLRRE
jgi:hypothetical protein